MPASTLKKKAKQTTTVTSKYTYSWGANTAEGSASMKELLGGKGANLAEMSRIGLPVPPGFTITTEVCSHYYANKQSWPVGLEATIKDNISSLEKQLGFTFGNAKGFPLLLAIRSGAQISMPGMMDSILNLGLNDTTVLALAKATSNERFAWDCYRRFIQMYGDVVMGVQRGENEDQEPFDHILETYKDETYTSYVDDAELTVADQKELVTRFKALIKSRTKKQFPSDPWEQLNGAVNAVFKSWMNDRAIQYRHKYSIPSSMGTAVNIQAMVYGNTGEFSGSGVAFTRNPTNGINELYGDYIENAQGEDVVSGVRTPEPVTSMQEKLPLVFTELLKVRTLLETHFKDMQDFEFTVQDKKLYILQTRTGKRTAAAALKISVDMANEGLISEATAILRNPVEQLSQLTTPLFDMAVLKTTPVIATGLPAGPGCITGKIYLNSQRALEASERGEKVLLVRVETSPDDLKGMLAAEGILTSRGGVSSHAALIARQMGKVCVCGAAALKIDYTNKTITVGSRTYKEGDALSIDGSTGNVYAGPIPVLASVIILGKNGDAAAKKSERYKNYACLLKWGQKLSKIKETKPEVLTTFKALVELK